ncbi:hypothetical protein HDU99_009643, partial [Rhizoclosmatium hyalinum]
MSKMWSSEALRPEIARLEAANKELESKLAANNASYLALQEQQKSLEAMAQQNTVLLQQKTVENSKLFKELKVWQGKHDVLAKENEILKQQRDIFKNPPPLSTGTTPSSTPFPGEEPAASVQQRKERYSSLGSNQMQANRLSDSTTVSVRSVDRSQMHPNRISQASSQLTPPSATPSNSTVDTEPLFAQIQTNLQSLHKALRAAKSSAEIDPPLLLSPLKTLLLTCRTVSETATPIDSTLLTLTEDAKHRLSDSLVALMSTTKSFSLKEQGVTPLDVDRHLQSVAACVESLHLVVTTPPALADPLF